MEQLHDTHLISNSSISNHSFGNDWEEKAYKFDEATFNTLVRGMQTQAEKIENTKNKRRRFKLESIAENNKSISLLKKFPLKEGNNIDQTKKIIQFKHYNISELTEVEILNGKMSIIEIKKERHNVFFREPNLNIEFQGNKNIIQDKFSREVEITYQGKTSLKITRLIGGINNGEFYIDQSPNILSIEDITKKHNSSLNNNDNNNKLNSSKLFKIENHSFNIKEKQKLFQLSSNELSILNPSYKSDILSPKGNNHLSIICKNKNDLTSSHGPMYKSDDKFNIEQIKLNKLKSLQNKNNFLFSKGDNFIIESNPQNSFERFSVIKNRNFYEVPSNNSSISLTPRRWNIEHECKSIQVSLDVDANNKDQSKYKKKDALGNSIHPSEESSFSSKNDEKEDKIEEEGEEDAAQELAEKEGEKNNQNEEEKNVDTSTNYKKPQINNTPYYLRNINNERKESNASYDQFKNLRLDNNDKIKNFKEYQLKNKKFLNDSNKSSFNESVNNNDIEMKENKKLTNKKLSKINNEPKKGKQSKNNHQSSLKCNHNISGVSYHKHIGTTDNCPVCLEKLKKISENLNSKYSGNNSNILLNANNSHGGSFYETYEKNVDYYKNIMGRTTTNKEIISPKNTSKIKFNSKLNTKEQQIKGKMDTNINPQPMPKSPSASTFNFVNGNAKRIVNNRTQHKRNSSQSNNMSLVQFPAIKN